MEIQSVFLFLLFLWAHIHLIFSITDPRDGNVSWHPYYWSKVSFVCCKWIYFIWFRVRLFKLFFRKKNHV